METVIFGFESRLRSAIEHMGTKKFRPPNIADAMKLRKSERHNMAQLHARIFLELTKMVDAGKLERRQEYFINPLGEPPK